MSEQEQLSAQAQAEATPLGAAAVAPDAAVMTLSPAVTSADPAPADPPAEDASYKEPVPSGALGALLDEMHMAVEYASDEVKHTVRHLVARMRDML